MVSMQPSLSSPVRTQPSDAASLSTTRSPSPPTSPESERHVDPTRPRSFSSHILCHTDTRTSSTIASTMSVPRRRSEDTARQAPSPQPQTPSPTFRKAVVAHANSPPPSPASSSTQAMISSPRNQETEQTPPSSASQPAVKLPQPLITDISLYTNPHLTPSEEADSATLDELAHLVRLSKYQERKRANTRIRLQRTLISNALSARLTRCGDMVQKNLTDCFLKNDKKPFAELYDTMQDIRKSCDEVRRYALIEPEMEALQSPGLGSSESLDTPTGSVSGAGSTAGSGTPFLQEISASARETFLAFLSRIRNDPDYLASRITSLTNSERAAIYSFHVGLEPYESVLPFYSKPNSRSLGSTSSRNANNNPNHTKQRLLSFQRHDALSALIHTCFANSAGPDSAEDKRRTDIWASACARLISKSMPEPTLIYVLNVWVSMRDWPGRSNMEWYLMKILEDGAFVLDRAEDQQGTRFNISEWTQKDSIAMDEFYDRAIDELFEIIDDEDSTGIPEGLIELGNQILRRLDRNLVGTTREWFVYKYLFSVWLHSVMIHPEGYGMMTDYHISEYGRLRILKEVALRAANPVVDMLVTAKSRPVSTPPKIKAHVENILHRFKGSSSKSRPRLLKARSITSLRETTEVHPYLVISPADLVTLVNALFPEKRPMSAASIRSGAPSISGMSTISQPMSVAQPRSNANGETASVISTSVSSMMSDVTTSQEPLIEAQTTGASARSSPPALEPPGRDQMGNYEDDGYRLRLALHELTQSLGVEVVSGTCHPCADRWAVLFISSDGKSLSTHMTYDPDDDPEEENSSSLSETDEDEVEEERPELDKDYHQLRDCILKLVEDFEIPQTLEQDGGKQTFSNRASSLKKYRSRNKIITTEKSSPSRNPYRRRLSGISSRSNSPLPTTDKGKDAVDKAQEQPVLIAMLTAASSASRAQSDFVSAHLYWRTLQQLNALCSPSLRANGFATLLNIFSRGPRDSIRRSASAIEEYDAWLVWLKQSQERAEGLIDVMMRRLRGLRDKMWYHIDVRNSAPYEHSRNIAIALKIMGMRGKRNRIHGPRSAATTYIYRTESQIMDLLAAGADEGGPNKLSDDQAEKTARFLREYGIENFCKGEERIHRFCCEIEGCIGKLIGENMIDGPVLWSSDLYRRDRMQFVEAPSVRRNNTDFPFINDDASSVISDVNGRFTPASSRTGSVNRDLRGMTALNASHASIDSTRFGFSRASTAMSDILDAGEYFGMSSPVRTIDSASTYWSPFQYAGAASSTTSRAQSPTTSITNFSSSFSGGTQSHADRAGTRPSTAISSNETVYQQRLNEEKSRFLNDLQQTLTSLLLSDLGNALFSRGSETDSWFGDLGQDCIDRRDAAERKARKRRSKPRVIAKKQSFGNLRDAHAEGENADSSGAREAAPGASGSVDGGYSNESSAATSNTISSKKSTRSRRDAMPEFPFTKAYQRLLKMFCVHPNPYAKLNALFELQHLIMASLTSGSTRRRLAWIQRNSEFKNDDRSNAGRSRPFDEQMDSLKERRSQTMQAPSTANNRQLSGSLSAETRAMANASPMAANTDAIVTVLQSLFRDPNVRPKTLFRDLQFISSFVPTSVLDKTERGKAFWDCGLAALGLKQEVCRTMVEMADEIVGFYTKTRKNVPAAPSSTASSSVDGEPVSPRDDRGRSTPTPGSQRAQDPTPTPPTPPPPTTAYRLEDAARMWTVTAKEGDPTSQRELAIFYLSNPELVDRITLPLSKPREVFKQAVMDKYGGASRTYGPHHDRTSAGHGSGMGSHRPSTSSGSAGAGGASGSQPGDVRSDPALMCVAIHWMEAAELGGDVLARTFLGQNEIVGL